MTDTAGLQARIDAELAASQRALEQAQATAVQTYEGRQQRLKLFEQRCEQLREIWRPRLELLGQKFAGQVKVTPRITKGLREAAFDFQSALATVQVRFSASTDTDVRKLVLDYHLDILPILMQCERHAQAEFPLEAIDAAAVGRWIDDRIVGFVRTYLSMSQNEYYLRDHMVVDPVANIRFPKFAAAATLERGGKTYYFISDQTRGEFEQKSG